MLLAIAADKLGVEIPIPDHTTLSRRLKTLGEIPFRAVASNRPIHLLIDSTGLRIHVGNLRKPPKNRAWRKLHAAVEGNTGEIVASDLTGRRTFDCTQVAALLGQINGEVTSVSADGAYDTGGVYEAAQPHGEGRAVRVLFPPGRTAQLSPEPSVAMMERNQNIRSIRRLGRREWQKRSGYSKRSMVENTIYRYKTIHRRSYEESYPGGPAGGGATRVQGPQHDDESRDARQQRSGVILEGEAGNLG